MRRSPPARWTPLRRCSQRTRGERNRRQGAATWRGQRHRRGDPHFRARHSRVHTALCTRRWSVCSSSRLSPTTHRALSPVLSGSGFYLQRLICFLFCFRECPPLISFVTRFWSRPLRVEMTSERPVTMPGSMSLSDRPPPPGQRQLAAVPAGETTMMSGSGSTVFPAGIIDPSVPIRNINMKFAVVVGLIEVGEVNNRDIVETVLNLVSTGFPLFSLWLDRRLLLHP